MTSRLKDAALSAATGLGLDRLAARLNRGRLCILCYHGIWTGPDAWYGRSLFMSPRSFVRRLELLRAGKFRVLDLEEALGRLAAGTLPERAVAITIDDGWHGTYTHMLPALEAAGFPATLYAYTDPVVRHFPVFPVLTGYLLAKGQPAVIDMRELGADDGARYDLARAEEHERCFEAVTGLLFAKADDGAWREPLGRFAANLGIDVEPLLRARVFDLMTPEELRDAARRGLRIELHTHDHHFPLEDTAALRKTIARNREHLSDIVGGRFRHFCYPSGRHSEARLADLAALGIVSATTCRAGFADRDTPPLLLPRILDGEAVGEAEFRAEISGLLELRRRLTLRQASLRAPASASA